MTYKINKGEQRMKNLLIVLTGFIGVIIGATISGVIAYQIFQKQLLINQYAVLVEDIEKAFASSSLWKSEKTDDSRKRQLKTEAELSINRAWSRALVTLPDPIFLEIDKMIERKRMDVKTKIRVYYLLRQHLYPKTSIQYDDIMTRTISLQE